MTDKETFNKLLESAGIEFSPGYRNPKFQLRGTDSTLLVSNSGGRGGDGCHSEWHFDTAGKLIGVAHHD